MEVVRVAIIGIGIMGKQYSQLIAQNEVKGMQLCAVCVRSEETQEWCKENLKNIPIYGSSDELFEHSDKLDAVIIATPHRIHPKLAVQAFEHGLHVLCDKPAAVTKKDAVWMKETADIYKKAYAMVFHNRVFPVYKLTKSIITSGDLGDIIKVLWKNTLYFRTECYHKASSWRSSWNGEGGGVLMNQGQHPLDLWQWMFGMPNKIESKIGFGVYNDITVDDDSLIYMEYENGMRGYFYICTGEPAGEERVEIVGTNMKLIISDHQLEAYTYDMSVEEFRKTNTIPYGNLNYKKEVINLDNRPNAYKVILSNFAAHILHGEPLIVDGAEGTHSVELTNAAYLSAWKKEAVMLPIPDEEYAAMLENYCELEKKGG